MINFIFFISIIQSMFSCNTKPEAEIYLIPDTYKGKVNIIFNQTEGANIKYENGSRVYEIPKDGILLTKFNDEYGEIDHKYYMVDSLGHRRPLEIIADENNIFNDSIVGVYRDGTVGVYGDSEDPKSLHYQEFYVTDKRSFDMYFKQDYQIIFSSKISKLTNFDF